MGKKKITNRKVILSFDENSEGVHITIDHEGFNGDAKAIPLYIHAALESLIAVTERPEKK